ncbi:MAG: alpha/beta hydrolase [Oscillospiraceae bacterium]|nr:alpha/beta hydrolase [Oscillospiraceae bacterium]
MKTSEIILSAAAGAAALAGGWYATGKSFVDAALNREQPLLATRISALVNGGKKPDDLSRKAEDAARRTKILPMERVELTAWDGVHLVGHWYGCHDPKRVVIGMHGWRSAWYRDFAGILPFWHEHGCAVLLTEQRAHGESGGDTICFGAKERFDCLDWAEYAAERTGGVLPIWLAGVSMGATTVLLASGLARVSPAVRGVMADCGFISADAIWAHVAKDNFHLPYALFKPLTDRLCIRKTGCGPAEASTTAALKRTRLPVLLVHGEADSFVPPSMSVKNYKSCAGPKRLLLVPGARHGMSYLVDTSSYESAVMDFWSAYETK